MSGPTRQRPAGRRSTSSLDRRKQADMVGGGFRDRERETMSPAALCQTQLSRLRRVLHVVADDDPRYRRQLDEAGIDIDGLDCHGDAQDLPFSTAADVRRRHRPGSVATSWRGALRVCVDRGADGQSLAVGFDGRDDEVRRELVARWLAAGGLRCGEVLQDVHGRRLRGCGLAAVDLAAAAELLGASSVLAPDDDADLQVDLLRASRAAALSGTVAAVLEVAEAFARRTGELDLSVRVGFLDGWPEGAWHVADGMPRDIEETRQTIEATLGIDTLLAYGLPELGGPVVACECLAKTGLHINEDSYLAEVVDPDSAITLPEGQLGELVVTTLSRGAFPLIRYRTGDLCRLDYEPCVCGRTFARMSFPEGRLGTP